MTDRDQHTSPARAHGSARNPGRSRRSRPLVIATLALAATAVLGGCAQGSDNAVCRDDQHQSRTDDKRCQDNQPDVDWVHFDPGRRVPAVGEPIEPDETSPFPPSSSAPRGGLSTSAATAGQDDSSESGSSGSSGSSSRSGSGGYVMTPDEPEEDDDDE